MATASAQQRTLHRLGRGGLGGQRKSFALRHACWTGFDGLKAIAIVAIASSLLVPSALKAQKTPAASPAPAPLPSDLKNYPGLLPEFGQLFAKLQQEVEPPPRRSQSRLLPLLPESTVFYAALPNYGDISHQVLTAFRAELQQSSVLRDWWQHGDMATAGPKLEDGLQKVYELSQFLGDEVVVAGSPAEGSDGPKLLILAEVKKPGLKDFLLKTSKALAADSKQTPRVLDLTELAVARKSQAGSQLAILVRPDFVVGALDVESLRAFSARLDSHSAEFASTAFGQRVVEAYKDGLTVVAAADLEQILKKVPGGPRQQVFERTGFGDAKYAVWSHTSLPGGQSATQAELSFTGPRRGIASWLAAPGPMGSLDFVSAQALMAGSILLKDPALIFDDVSDLATAANPNALLGLEQMERGMKLNLRADLLSHLSGEIGYEIDAASAPQPAWKVILRVDDPLRVQNSFAKLLAMAPVKASVSEQDGVAYHILTIASAQPKPTEIAYAFLDGYLILASSPQMLAEGIRVHRSGESLAKSTKFLAASANSSPASAILYHEPSALAALSTRQLPAEVAALFSQLPHSQTAATVACFYGEESAIRSASKSAGLDPSAVLVGAAIAIPNLLRARTAANEASAVASIRTVNTAQVTYSANYPQRGFAPDLARLGPDPTSVGKSSIEHAALVDAALAKQTCTAGAWCEKSGYKFTVTSGCKTKPCRDYVVVGTPASGHSGSRSFCSTADAIIHFKTGDPIPATVTADECRSWSALP